MNSENQALKIIGKIFSVIGWIVLLIPLLFFALVKGLLAGSGYKK